MIEIKQVARWCALAGALIAGTVTAAPVVLRASHQFPGGKGDVRDDMVQMIAREAKAANVGLDVQVYPGASLFKPNQQWNAIAEGQLDITLFPLDYASGKVPAFSATLMPGLVRSQERAKRINDSQFMKDIRAEIEKHGVIVLSDAWFAGGMAAKSGCIASRADLKGMKFRAAGPTFAGMWEAAGASIVSPPCNEIYNAFQTGVVTGTDTSLGTFASDAPLRGDGLPHRAGQQRAVDHVRALADVQEVFDKSGQAAAGGPPRGRPKAQAYYESKADAVNAEAIKAFEDHKVKVVTLTDAEYNAWIEIAKKSAYARFAKDVPNGQKLIDEALSVK